MSHQPTRGEHRTLLGFLSGERHNVLTAWPPVLTRVHVGFEYSKQYSSFQKAYFHTCFKWTQNHSIIFLVSGDASQRNLPYYGNL